MTRDKAFAEPARKVPRAPVVERLPAPVAQGAEPVRVARMAMTATDELSGGASRATGGGGMDLESGSQARAGSMRALQRTMGSGRVSRALAAGGPPAPGVRRACACGGEGGSGPECEPELSALRRGPAEPGGPSVA
jgi:hypothetical protein